MNNYEKYLVTRPLFSRFSRENDIPVIRNENLNLDNAAFINFTNLKKSKKNSIVLTFHHDKVLNTLWNNPLKYVSKFRNCLAVVTPDYTIQQGMDLELIRMNIYRNRWLGCTWQQYGVKVIPSVSWADSSTYDVCFSGIEENGLVAVSTLGCRKPKERRIFLDGYAELYKRKHPCLILCFGNVLDGMKGQILPIAYNEGFGKEKNYTFEPLFNFSRIINLKGDEKYGW